MVEDRGRLMEPCTVGDEPVKSKTSVSLLTFIFTDNLTGFGVNRFFFFDISAFLDIKMCREGVAIIFLDFIDPRLHFGGFYSLVAPILAAVEFRENWVRM